MSLKSQCSKAVNPKRNRFHFHLSFFVILILGLLFSATSCKSKKENKEEYDFFEDLANTEAPKSVYSSEEVKYLIESTKSFMSNVELFYDVLNEEQWEKADLKISLFKEEFQNLRIEMTDEEQYAFNKLMGNYLAFKTKKSGKDIEKNLQDTKEKLEGFLEKINE